MKIWRSRLEAVWVNSMQVVRERRTELRIFPADRFSVVVLLLFFAQLGCQSSGMSAGTADGHGGIVLSGPGLRELGDGESGGDRGVVELAGASITRVSLQLDEPAEKSEEKQESAGVRVQPKSGSRVRSRPASRAVAGAARGTTGRGATAVLESGEVSGASEAVESAVGAGVALGDRVASDDRAALGDRVASGAGSGHSLMPRPVESAEVPEEETGMLDRFRALYSPKGEESGERVRRQMLRWSDPFGLLKERTESVGAENPVESAESGRSASGGAERIGVDFDMESGAGGSGRVVEAGPLLLESLIADLEGELGAWPTGAGGQPERLAEWRKKQTDLRMLYCVSGRAADAARVIEGLPREEQEFWQSMMLAMNRTRAGGEGESRAEELTEALGQVRAAARALQPLSKLEIHRLQFCTRIDGFGNVTAFPTADFEPGQRLLLYAGVRNFRSELTSEGQYRSEFAAVVEFLREEDGEVLERIRLPQIPDECDEERTDYFQSFELTAPVLEGGYIVRLQLRDQLTRQTAEARLRMRIR